MDNFATMEHLERFLGRLSSYGHQPCLEDDSAIHSYSQLLEELQRWQARFDNLNISPGTVVGIRTDYSVFAIAALLALCARRAVAALVPRQGDIDLYLADARAVALLDLQDQGDYDYRPVGGSTDHPLLAKLRADGEGGFILFTSGSTGPPKAAIQSIERFLYKFHKPTRRFRTLAFLMFDHIAGMDTAFYTLAGGGTLILTRRRDPNAVLKLIESRKVEVLPTSPTFLRILCAIGELDKCDLSSLKIITYGSEPMDSTTLTRINKLLPSVQVVQKYGSTETGSPRSVSQANDSLWLKIKTDDVETKVVDDVLWIRGGSAILGYLNAPSPFDDNGWYCTGDLVDIDGEWIRFRGKVADSVNVGGEKVTPAEVERTILELEYVRDVSVVGEAHPLMGQVVGARVVLLANTVDPNEAAKLIRGHCRRRLPPYKVPIKVEIVSALPVTHRHKTQRRPVSD